MTRKKKKNIPFHIAHNYKQYELEDGTKFWAKDEEDALSYSSYTSKIKSVETQEAQESARNEK
tara:strand:- start:1650 stop:1838 length:189 start_codon:yes stop_codon:yes gene_type:complete